MIFQNAVKGFDPLPLLRIYPKKLLELYNFSSENQPKCPAVNWVNNDDTLGWHGSRE